MCNSLMAGFEADRTPLHEAALQGRILPIKMLLSQGLHVGVVTLDGITPLHEACLGGHLACAKLLLDHEADASAISVSGHTPVFNACCSGNAALLRLLLKHSSAHHPAHLLNSPIHEAAKRGHTECVELLLSHGVNADLELPDLGTPLYCACASRRVECVEKLLILGADVNCGCGLDTPLHAAVRVGAVKVVELLLEHGANTKCRNLKGEAASDLAKEHNILHILQTTGPSSLSQLSRLCIRRALGQQRLFRAKSLHLSHILHDYILYQ